jgi:hypothetical protein
VGRGLGDPMPDTPKRKNSIVEDVIAKVIEAKPAKVR